MVRKVNDKRKHRKSVKKSSTEINISKEISTETVKSTNNNRKRKLSVDAEDCLKKSKVSENIALKLEHDTNESDAEDSELSIKDEEIVNEEKPIKVLTDKQIKDHKLAEERKQYQAEQILKNRLEMKNKKEKAMEGVKEMFLDAPKVESESLKEQIHKRMIERMNRTVVMNNIPNKFSINDVKTLVPEFVSCTIPYNSYHHKVGGTAYIDLESAQKAVEIADRLRNSEIKGRKPFAMVQTRIIEDVEKYNCNRLVISSLKCSTTREQLKEAFPNAARIELIPLKGIDRKCSQTAIVEYASIEETIADYDSKHGSLINDQPINVKFQIRMDSNIKDKHHLFDKKRLAVLGVKTNATIDEFKRCFPKSIKIQPAFSKGMAHIVYSNEEDCATDKALINVHNPPAKWRVSYAIGGPKDLKTPEIPKKIKEKAPRPMKKNGGDKDKPKFGNKFENKKFEGKRNFGRSIKFGKAPRQIDSKPPSIPKNAEDFKKLAKKNDLKRKEKRKLKKEKKRK